MSDLSFKNTTGIPRDWLDTSVVRHVDDPYSVEALAEAEKTSIDLGYIDMTACVEGRGGSIKYRGVEAMISADLPEGLITAHHLFVDAAQRILSRERYLDSNIDFTYRSNPVPPGGRQVGGRPHLDGLSSNFGGTSRLRLLGIACDALPTTLLQGPLKPELLRPNGELENLMILKRLRKVSAPISRLTLMPPSLLHDATRDDTGTHEPTSRLFMRWHLKV